MKRWILLVLALCLTGCAQDRPKTPEARIAAVLEATEAQDAVFVAREPLSILSGDEYLHYISEAAQMSFYFRPEDGSLALAENPQADFEAAASAYSDLSAEEHTAYAMAYAQACIAADLIGELEVEEAPDEDDYSKDYVFAEYYDGIPTGTRVFVSCLRNDEIYYVMPKFGNLFEPGAFGGYRLRNGRDFIGEKAARETALGQLEQIGGEYRPTEAEPVIELRAMGEDLFYRVSMEAATETGWFRIYTVDVDAYDGEILETTYTKGSPKES